MNILFERSKQGHKLYNEDISGHVDNFAWVIDGATDIFHNEAYAGNRDVQWFVENLNRTIEETASNNSGKTPKELMMLVGDIIRQSVPSMGYADFTLPNYTMAMCRQYRDTMQLYLLSDCSIHRGVDGNVIFFTDSRLQSLKKRLGYKPKEVLPIEVQKKIRATANRSDTYAVGTRCGLGIPDGVELTFPIKPGDKYLLATDGFDIPLTLHDFTSDGIAGLIAGYDNSDDCTVLMIEV